MTAMVVVVVNSFLHDFGKFGQVISCQEARKSFRFETSKERFHDWIVAGAIQGILETYVILSQKLAGPSITGVDGILVMVHDHVLPR